MMAFEAMEEEGFTQAETEKREVFAPYTGVAIENPISNKKHVNKNLNGKYFLEPVTG